MELGVGRGDITALESVGLFGFGSLTQIARGFQQRLYARAFLLRQEAQLVALVVCDLGFIDPALRVAVLRRLAEVPEFAGWSPDGLMLSATHSHATPGGYSAYRMFNLSVRGHSQRVLDTLADGIVVAMRNAYAALSPGRLRLARVQVPEVGINRSLEAHLSNPPEDRCEPDGVDATLTQLRFETKRGRLLGSCNWYGAHPTNLVGTNRFIAGDNRGWASWALERGGVVVAYPLGPAGDVSPNRVLTPGDRLVGEGKDLRENTAIIGRRLAEGTRQLHRAAGEAVSGPLGVAWAEHHFPDLVAPAARSSTGEDAPLAPAILGHAFAAGTKDGRGPAWYDEGDASVLLSLAAGLAGFGAHPGQHPKPAFLPVSPRDAPQDLPVQLFRLGDVLIAAVPFELTVGAGRRLRRWLSEHHALPPERVILTTHANAYAGYQTTPEEYVHQRYEGGFTLFGREQLGALGHALLRLEPGPGVPRPLPEPPSLALACLDDPERAPTLPEGCRFGDVVEQPAGHARAGQTLSATFWSVAPRGQTRLVEVERLVDGVWQRVHDDHDWATSVEWLAARGGTQVRCSWSLPAQTKPGLYRIVHRARLAEAQAFVGVSRPIRVLSAVDRSRSPVNLFAGLSSAQLERARPLLAPRRLGGGDVLIEQGASDRDLYVVLGGRFSVRVGEIEVSRAGPGSVFGELAMFVEQPRSATVVAVEAAEVLALSLAQYEALLRDDHPVAHRLERLVLDALAERLRRLNFILHGLLQHEAPWERLSRGLRVALRWTRVEVPNPEKALAAIGVFRDASPEALAALAREFEGVRAPSGTALCVQDEPGNALHLLVDGLVRVSVGSARGASRWLADLGPGDAFGLTSLIEGSTCGATCTSSGEVALLVLPRERWERLREDDGPAGAALRRLAIRAFASQVSESNRHLASLRDDARGQLAQWLDASSRVPEVERLLEDSGSFEICRG